MKIQTLFLVGAIALAIVTGCSKKEEPAPPTPKAAEPAKQPEMPPSHAQAPSAQPSSPTTPPQEGQTPPSMPAPTKREVVVPEDVKKTWKAVVLQVTDKSANTSQDVTIDIGKSAKVGDLEITVEAFLPAFTMTADSFTSTSNETTNPAARLTVRENGKEVFSGFLFSMHPDVHPFQHEKYAILLKDFIKK